VAAWHSLRSTRFAWREPGVSVSHKPGTWQTSLLGIREQNQQRLLAEIGPDSGILGLQAGEDVNPADGSQRNGHSQGRCTRNDLVAGFESGRYSEYGPQPEGIWVGLGMSPPKQDVLFSFTVGSATGMSARSASVYGLRNFCRSLQRGDLDDFPEVHHGHRSEK